MNAREIAYWDRVGEAAIESRRENIYKRVEIVRRVLQRPPVTQRVLEIGVGKGVIAGAVLSACCWKVSYTGTELAPSFRDFAREKMGLNVVQTDVTSLPNGPFDQVWAFDTLEHVSREDREKGYVEIDRVLAKHGIIVLNLPLGESHHEGEFEHGITDDDATALARVCNARVVQWDAYRIPVLNIPYSFVVLQR